MGIPMTRDDKTLNDSRTEITLRGSVSGIHSEPEKQELDVEHSVAFTDPNDPDDPYNWSKTRKWSIVVVVSVMSTLNTVATMACAPAAPQILSDFDSGRADLYTTLLVSIWELGECFGPFIIGPFADHFGRLPVWHVYNILFTACSLISGFSQNIHMLVAFRFLNGFGSAALTLSPAIVSDMFVPEERATVLGLEALLPMVGPALGPIIGSTVNEALGWRWIFWIIAIAVALFDLISIFVFSETHRGLIARRRARRTENIQAGPKFSLAIVLRTFKIWYLFPLAFVMATYFAILYGFEYLVLTTLTEVFEDQYSIATGSVGLVFLGWGTGRAIGMLAGGPGSDWYLKKMKAIRGNKLRAEDRIFPGVVGGILVGLGFFLYGWTAQARVQWMAPIVGSAIGSFGLALTWIATKAYLVDAFPDYTASASAAGSILMSLLGALIPLAGLPLYAHLGYGWGNSLLGFLAIAIVPVPLFFVRLHELGKLGSRSGRQI